MHSPYVNPYCSTVEVPFVQVPEAKDILAYRDRETQGKRNAAESRGRPDFRSGDEHLALPTLYVWIAGEHDVLPTIITAKDV